VTTYPTETVRAGRIPPHIDKRSEHGPFDIIGDVHGCADELFELLDRLGYTVGGGFFTHPDGRRAIFFGDLCDRGPRNVDVLRAVMTERLCRLAVNPARGDADKFQFRIAQRGQLAAEYTCSIYEYVLPVTTGS
jgi:hypothetical protein